MSTILKLANGAELPLASAPTISGGTASFQIVRSDTITAESVYAAVKDFSNTKSFQIAIDGTASAAYSNYELFGMVGIDGGNIAFTMRQKSNVEIKLDEQAKAIAELSVLVAGGVK